MLIGGLLIFALLIGLYFGLDYPGFINTGAATAFLTCNHGFDLINGKCMDIDECKLTREKGPELVMNYES